jgi:hypothetical protein
MEALRDRIFKSVYEREGNSPEKVTWPEGKIALGIGGHSFRGTRMANTIPDVTPRDEAGS